MSNVRCCSCCEGTWLQTKWDFLRSIVHDIVDNPFFEWTILLLIFASRSIIGFGNVSIFYICSLSLCFEDINLQDNEELKFILKIVNLVFAVLFTIEMFLKWIAFGLWRYFGSVWTCLDFIIVIVSPNKISSDHKSHRCTGVGRELGGGGQFEPDGVQKLAHTEGAQAVEGYLALAGNEGED